MKTIDRTQGLNEPTIEEIKNSEFFGFSTPTNLIIADSSSDLGNYAIIGDEKPKSLKNMAQGFLNSYKKGIEFCCIQVPEKLPKGLKDKMSLMLSYGAWQAAGLVGLLAKHAVSAVVESVKESRKDSNEKSPEEVLSFVIPVINIIGAETLTISKGHLGFSETTIVKLLTENSNKEKETFWIEAKQEFIDALFKLRFKEEKKLGVSENELRKFTT
jgi:hypothetical protein